MNDPFEARRNYLLATKQELLNDQALYDYHFRGLEIPPKDLRKIVETHNDAELSLGTNLVLPVDHWFKDHGALCLTNDPSNISMWVHYADNHQGYCVIFEIDFDEIYKILEKDHPFKNDRTSFDNFVENIINPDYDAREILHFTQKLDPGKKFIFTKVSYENHLPVIKETILAQKDIESTQIHHGNPYHLNKYIVQNSVGVKFKQWEYENEYRLISNACSEKIQVNAFKRISIFKNHRNYYG
jgi:hypothetical protein